MVNDSIIRDVITPHNPGSVVDPDGTLETDGCTRTSAKDEEVVSQVQRF